MMSRTMTVVGVFDEMRQAEEAVRDLRDAGFRPDQIGILVREHYETDVARSDDEGVYNTEEGAINGAVTGSLAGGLLGALAAIVVPGVGPVLASAILAGLLTGATAGAAAGGLLGALIGMGVPEEEARYYETELRAGRILVTVTTDDDGDAARALLRRHGGHDLVTAREAPAGAQPA
jgi:hypothetical protein